MASKNGESLLQKVITLSDLSSLVVTSTRHLRRLTVSGVLRRKAGHYVLGQVIPQFVEHLRDSVADASGNEDEKHYRTAKATRMLALAAIADMELKRQRGEYVYRTEAESTWAKRLTSIKSGLLSIPSDVADELVGKSAREIRALLAERIRTALTTAASLRGDVSKRAAAVLNDDKDDES